MAHSIVVDLLMRTGSFVTDTVRASKQLAKFEKDVIASGKRIAGGVVAITAAIGAGLAVVNRLADGIAQYQDIAEKIGDSASAVSSLQLAADTSSTSLDSLAAASVKLTSALSKTDDESDAVAKALAAINIPLEDFKRLSPTDQLQRLADALGEFEDGAAKTAVAVALFGRAGADLIPFLNNLAGAQRRATLSDEQIQRADQFTKQMAAMRSEMQTLIKVVSADLIDPFAEFVRYLREGASAGGLIAAAGEALKVTFQAIAVLAANVVFVFQAMGREIGAIAAQAVALAKLDLKGFRTISDAVKADGVRARAELDAFEKRMLGLYGKVSFSPDDQSAAEARRLGLAKPAINFSGATGGGSAKTAKQEIDRAAEALKSLRREIQVFGQDNDTLAKTLAFQDLKPSIAQLEQYKSGLASLEQLRAADAVQKMLDALVSERDALVLSKEQITARDLALKGATGTQVEFALQVIKSTDAMRAQQELMDEGKRLTEQMRTPLEALLARYERLNDLLRAGAVDSATYRRAVVEAQDAFAKATEPVEKAVEQTNDAARELGMTFSSAFEDAIVEGKGLREVLKGMEQDIMRIVTRKLVTEPLANSITGALSGLGGSGGAGAGGMFASFLGSIFGGAKAAGGPVDPRHAYLVGERGPEMFVPATAGSVLPSPQTSAALGGRSIVVNPTFYLSGPVSLRTQQQIAAETARAVAAANARLN